MNEGSECVEGREGKGRALGGAQGGEKGREWRSCDDGGGTFGMEYVETWFGVSWVELNRSSGGFQVKSDRPMTI